MTREEIQELINSDFHVLKEGIAIKVDGEIIDYIQQLDEKDSPVYVLKDLLDWSDDELQQLQPAAL
ncbi:MULTISPECIES: hypothetical protein [Sphingobacterium]|jgi:hypothetical protein|uniref:Transposase n=1 Tax=Sphingobacterium litopenaei TaxID=2763500 RepID=A0ABR7YB27_9SPHI|nr:MULTISPECIES: hypothetical protein [Sphingobacterium]MBD1428495.1 hypothetical protein [Sphingobacterium litopenaei]NGM71702.1 hypothetical protein [Sphingobacterium sp. SGL-16]